MVENGASTGEMGSADTLKLPKEKEVHYESKASALLTTRIGDGGASNNYSPRFPRSDQSVSEGELRYVWEGCTEDYRVDGRLRSERRPYSIMTSSSMSSGGEQMQMTTTTMPLHLSNGSSRVCLPDGTTDVLCHVTAEMARPSRLRPTEGTVELNVEWFGGVPGSSGTGTNHNEVEPAPTLRHLVLPHVVSTPSLCVVPGRYAWKLSVEVTILAADGSVEDAASMAVCAALGVTVLPPVRAVECFHDNKNYNNNNSLLEKKPSEEYVLESSDVAHAVGLNARDVPVVVTVCVLERPHQKKKGKGGDRDTLVLDARSEEELCAVDRIRVSVDRQGSVCGVYGAGAGVVSFGTLGRVMELACATAVDCVFPDLDRPRRFHNSNTGSDGVERHKDMLQGPFRFL